MASGHCDARKLLFPVIYLCKMRLESNLTGRIWRRGFRTTEPSDRNCEVPFLSLFLHSFKMFDKFVLTRQKLKYKPVGGHLQF